MSGPDPGALEDRYTPPSPWCPHPSRWHSDTADATEREVSALAAAFVTALQPDVVLETGTNTAQTALAIGKALRASGHGRLWTVEVDPALAASARTALAGLPVTVVRADTAHWDPPPGAGFAWIDSGPAEGAPAGDWAALRLAEIRRWLPSFAPGAVIGIHDTAPHHPVMRAVGPFLKERGMQFLNLRTPRGVVFAQVP